MSDRTGVELRRLSLALRTAALVLLVVGFSGAVASGASPVGADSAWSLAFLAGVAAAAASIYLGIFGAETE